MRAGLMLVLAFAVGCAPKTSFLTARRQMPESTYFYSTLSKRQARAVERLVPEHGVVTRYGKTKREWIYVIDDPGVATGVPRFEFEALKACEIVVKLARVSDIGGLGINAGDVRRRDQFTRTFKGATMPDAIALLQALATNPFDAAKANAPEAWQAVAQETQIDPTEVGFAIEATAELITGSTIGETSRATLYTLTSRSPYQRASDAATK